MINIPAISKLSDFKQSIEDKSASCAVVGSSSTILDDELGIEIDSHDIIIRCNQAITAGFERHVGSKTTYRMMNSHSFWATRLDWPSRQSMCNKHERFDPDFLTKIKNETIIAKRDVPPEQFQGLLKKMSANGNTTLFLNIGFHNFCDSIVHGKSASSGLVSIILAMKNFKKTTCYGFKFREGEYNHYFEKIKPYNQDCHHFMLEKDIMEWLHESGHITLR